MSILDLKDVIKIYPLPRNTRNPDAVAKWIEEVASKAHLDHAKAGRRAINPLTLSNREAKLVLEYLRYECLTVGVIDEARDLAPVSFPQAPGQNWDAPPTDSLGGQAPLTEFGLTLIRQRASDLETRFRANQHEPAVQKKIATELAVLLNQLGEEESTLRNRSRVHGRGSMERQRRAIEETKEGVLRNARSIVEVLEHEKPGRRPGVRWQVQVRPGGGVIQVPVPRARR